MTQVYTLGYAAAGAASCLEALMTDPAMTLIDIRFRPASRFSPTFRRAALQQRFAQRYCHVPELGNSNFADRSLPIVLADVTVGLSSVLFWLERGYPICLLCACAHVESCHRGVVAQMIVERFPCPITHL